MAAQLRSIPDDKSRAATERRWQDIAEMASQGSSSRQIAARFGMAEPSLRAAARRRGVDIPAGRIVGGLRRHDPNRIVRQAVQALEGLVLGIELVDFAGLDHRWLDEWIAGLRVGETGMRRLRKRLEALRDSATRLCPVCGRPVAGRADAVYCSGNCRVRAHRNPSVVTAEQH